MKSRLLLVVGITVSLSAKAQNPLFIPASISTTTMDLTLQNGITQFYNGVNTNTMGANGNLLGPTLIMNAGDDVTINVENQLGDETTIHWHGLHVAPEDDGGPHSIIQDGATWSPSFTVMDRAGINWYHPHLHMTTNEHVSKGIAGLIIVKDAEEAALLLPRTYGEDDFPMVIQTKGFDASGQIEWMSELDTSLMVNGTIDPVLDAPAQVVRFRVLNGSSQRIYNLGLTNNMGFQLIGTDGGLLSAPVALTRYRIAPGQRADILVDLSALQGQNIQFISYSSEFGNGIYGATNPGMMPQLTLPGYSSNPLNGSDYVLLDLNVVAPTASPITSIPTALVMHTPLQEGTEDITRTLTFTTQQNIVGPFLINGVDFDMNVINYTVPLGNREIWSLTNQTPIAHPFHIHDVQFYILDINGTPPPPELSGLNDVVLVPAGMGNVRFITEFLDFANDSVPYMYHCHMLTHEDDGMMGQFLVTDPNSGIHTLGAYPLEVYPNPTNDHLVLVHPEIENAVIHIFSISGAKMQTAPISTTIDQISFDLSDFPQGVYLIDVSINDEHTIQRVHKL